MSYIEKEKQFLNDKVETYVLGNSHVHKFTIDSYIKTFTEYVDKEGTALELGCSDGYSTSEISKLIDNLTVIDGSDRMIKKAQQNIENGKVRFECKLFEEITESNSYNYVFANYILEHVNDPNKLIDIIYNILTEDGLLFVTVPNAKSVSRQMAMEMEILDDLYALTENDINHGHRRVYDLDLLTMLFEKSKFKIVDKGGTYFKQFADFQLEKMIDNKIIGEEQLVGMHKLAKLYPDISGSIYVILRK